MEIAVTTSAFMLCTDMVIRIVRCHSEGCDTKVHGIKAVGFRYVNHFIWLSTKNAYMEN